ncbi:regulator of polyketide synthase expression [Mycobacteroides abscessus subsp. bolletii]|uniref:PucR family transcriptional regulator n=1 Tax=Mycobacteroides abscessus TaxID=36809 RepID=UPI0009A5740A|nr:helix-turn-helix domain-containing protein [Mycobacteroides abscessus]SKG72169.1 regulator of polyketide synthase expression [Mycobacteroides abscessus subsp. bolletii]SKH10580.1 regulator of polyketide synthase expression [Mycobacteroides abscessus subsp. bolletii]
MATAASDDHEWRSWIFELSGDGVDRVEPLSDAPTRQLVRTELGDGPVNWAVGTARDAADYILDVLPVFASDPAAEQFIRRAVEATSLGTLLAFAHRDADALWPQAEPADATSAFVRSGIPMDAVLRGIHICQEYLTRAILTEIDRLDRPLAHAQAASELLFRCFDQFSANVAALYSVESGKWSRSTTALRNELITNVLSGQLSDVVQVSKALDYDLEGSHIGAVLWLDGQIAQPTVPDDLKTALETFDHKLRAGPILRQWVSPSLVHQWHLDPADSVTDALHQVDCPPAPHVKMAIGTRAHGIAGFRVTHSEALRAHKVSRIAGDRLGWLVPYEQIELCALLVSDLAAAKSFVSRALGALAEDNPRAEELRLTLSVYLEMRRSVAQASRILHTHRNTVVYRIKKIETVLGLRVEELASVEIHVALHVARTLGPVVLLQADDVETRSGGR